LTRSGHLPTMRPNSAMKTPNADIESQRQVSTSKARAGRRPLQPQPKGGRARARRAEVGAPSDPRRGGRHRGVPDRVQDQGPAPRPQEDPPGVADETGFLSGPDLADREQQRLAAHRDVVSHRQGLGGQGRALLQRRRSRGGVRVVRKEDRPAVTRVISRTGGGARLHLSCADLQEA